MSDPQHIDPATGEIEPGEYFLRSGFNYDRDAASVASGLECRDPSLTQQQFAEDADINVLVRRFGLTGKMPESLYLPTYGDFSGIDDFRSALEAIDAAEASFMALPAHLRAELDNDPALFVDFCSNPANRDRLKELGLTRALDAPPAPPVPPAPPPPPGPAQ